MKNIVLISIDCLRADYSGYTKNPKLEPPCLTGLAEDGYAYDNCIVHAPFTTTSHASMLSGLYPFEHGVRHLRGEQLSSDVRMIQHDLMDVGYETYGLVSCYHMSHIGLHYGFYEYKFNPNIVADNYGRGLYSTAESITDMAIEKLAAHKPMFLFLHYFDAHVHIGDEYEQLYCDEILRIDKQIERLVNSAGDDTVFIITADHGKKWSGEHNFPYLNPRNPIVNPLPCEYKNIEGGHGAELYEEAVRVPLIVYNGTNKPHDLTSVVQSADIRNIVKSQVYDQEFPQNRHFSYLETLSPDQIFQDAIPQIGIRTDSWKLICYQSGIENNVRNFSGAELFDLQNDPREEKNIINERADIARQLLHNLLNIQKRAQYEAQPIEDQKYNDTISEKMKAMGYF